jgi:hypothetical protein
MDAVAEASGDDSPGSGAATPIPGELKIDIPRPGGTTPLNIPREREK